ncbi:MAG: DNA translocase FtsK 4TM domain-containing protein, partial [bacterium]
MREIFRSLMLGAPLEETTAARIRELTGLGMIGLSIWLLVAMVSFQVQSEGAVSGAENHGGQVGWQLANAAFLSMGLAGYLVSLLSFAWGAILITHREISLPVVRVLGTMCFLISFSFLLHLGFGPDDSQTAAMGDLSNWLPYGPGGWLAHIAVPTLEQRFGGAGIWILLMTTTAISFVLATDRAFFPAISALSTWLTERREQLGQSLVPAIGSWCRDLALGLWDFLRGADLKGAIAVKKPAAKKPIKKKKGKRTEPELEDEYEDEDEDEYEDEDEDEDEDEYEEEEEEDEYEEDEEEEEDWEEEELEEDEPIVPSKPMALPTPAKQPVYEPPTPPPGPWTLPPTDLLVPPSDAGSTDNEFLERNALALERALKSFKVIAEVVGVQVGPAVTLFELSVSEGTRMNRVTNLSQEIAATLRAKSVRIIAPIPGKSTIGIEIPNTKRRKVRISELINQRAYDKDFMALPLFLGMDAEGQPIVEDLARMPHLLIAGTTGSGKSVCINTIVASLLLTRSPHDARLILVDPKMVELMMFAGVPHLELPVVNDMRQATNVLNWAVEKMEARYELFKNAQVKNIKGYNALGEEKLRERLGDGFNEERTPRHVPYIVLIIDEMADLM